MASFTAEYNKAQEATAYENSSLQAKAEATERKAMEAEEKVAMASSLTTFICQSSLEFHQVKKAQFDEGVRAFMYNVWREHPEWDLSFLGEAARDMMD